MAIWLCAIAGHCALMRCTVALTLTLSQREKGLDRVARSSYADLRYRAELRPRKHPRSAPFPLSPSGERAGVRGIDPEYTTILKR